MLPVDESTTIVSRSIKKRSGESVMKKRMIVYVLTRCLQLTECRFPKDDQARRYSKAQTVHNISEVKDARQAGILYHKIISDAEEEKVTLEHVSESNVREAALCTTICKIAHLIKYGYVNEFKMVWEIDGQLYSGRADRINWDGITLEVCDFKTHSFNFMDDEDPEKDVAPDMPAHTLYNYKLQLHFYMYVLREILVKQPWEDHVKELRRRIFRGVFNYRKPIHPKIASQLCVPFTTSLEDLFYISLEQRRIFSAAKSAIAIWHAEQSRIECMRLRAASGNF